MDNTLISKLAKASLDVGGKLSADKTNKEQNYDYLSADKILSTCGQALAGQGVIVLPEVLAHETVLYEYTDQYGKAKKRYDSRVDYSFKITDGVTDLIQHWYGMGSDYSVPDKALYKAVTSGHKYFLMKLLCVGAGNEDGEHETEKEEKLKTVAQKEAEKKVDSAKSNGGKSTETVMTIDQAEAEWSSTLDLPYGMVETEQLERFHLGLSKSKKALTDEQKRKMAAIEYILDERRHGRKVISKPVVEPEDEPTPAHEGELGI